MRSSRLARALVSASLFALVMTVSVAPAHAAQAGAATAHISGSSATVAALNAEAAIAASETGVAVSSTSVAARGFECRGVVRCGFKFAKRPTKVIMTAAAGGGLVAAVSACTTLGIASGVACSVLGTVSGVVIADLIDAYHGNNCLFIAAIRPNAELVDC
jgi:hypothetical protein